MSIFSIHTHPSHAEGLKGIIFDCDGVLFDSWESNKQYYNLLLDYLGQPAMTPDQEAYVHSHTVHESMEYIVPQAMWDRIPEARASVDYRKALSYLHPSPGLFPLLRWLRSKGMRLAIATNRTTTMPLLEEHFGLRPYFNPIYTASMTFPKPHPEVVHRILEQWRFKRKDVAFIGDSSVDEATARNAGVRFWAYGSPLLQADRHIQDFYSFRLSLQKVLGP